jgi:hypothetical protein
MAAVTVNNSQYGNRHVIGDLIVRFFNITGASGSTLATGQNNIMFIDIQKVTQAGNPLGSTSSASLITGITYTNGANVTLTISSSAPMVNELIAVWSKS